MKQHIPVQDLSAAHFVALISLSWTIEETRKTKALQRKSFKLEFFFRRDKKLSQTINRSYDILSKIFLSQLNIREKLKTENDNTSLNFLLTLS